MKQSHGEGKGTYNSPQPSFHAVITLGATCTADIASEERGAANWGPDGRCSWAIERQQPAPLCTALITKYWSGKSSRIPMGASRFLRTAQHKALEPGKRPMEGPASCKAKTSDVVHDCTHHQLLHTRHTSQSCQNNHTHTQQSFY